MGHTVTWSGIRGSGSSLKNILKIDVTTLTSCTEVRLAVPFWSYSNLNPSITRRLPLTLNSPSSGKWDRLNFIIIDYISINKVVGL